MAGTRFAVDIDPFQRAIETDDGRLTATSRGVRTYADGTTEAWATIEGPGVRFDLFTPSRLVWSELGDLRVDPPTVIYNQ